LITYTYHKGLDVQKFLALKDIHPEELLAYIVDVYIDTFVKEMQCHIPFNDIFQRVTKVSILTHILN